MNRPCANQSKLRVMPHEAQGQPPVSSRKGQPHPGRKRAAGMKRAANTSPRIRKPNTSAQPSVTRRGRIKISLLLPG